MFFFFVLPVEFLFCFLILSGGAVRATNLSCSFMFGKWNVDHVFYSRANNRVSYTHLLRVFKAHLFSYSLPSRFLRYHSVLESTVSLFVLWDFKLKPEGSRLIYFPSRAAFRDRSPWTQPLKNFVAHPFVTSVTLLPGSSFLPHRNKWIVHLSVRRMVFTTSGEVKLSLVTTTVAPPPSKQPDVEPSE